MEYFLMTVEDAVNFLKDRCKETNGLIPRTFGGYYCGITNDIERREREHNAKFLGFVKANSFDSAVSLEARMNEEGFDTGDQLGNGQLDSIFVYVYKKTSQTVE